MCLLVSHMHWARPKQRQVPSRCTLVISAYDMYLWVLSFLPLLICGGNDFHSQTKQYLTQFRAHTNTHTSQWPSHWNFERPYNHINRTCFHTGSHSHKTTPHKSIHFCHPLFFPQSVPIPNNNACFSCHRCCCCFSFLALLVFLSSSRVAHVHRSKRKNASREMMMGSVGRSDITRNVSHSLIILARAHVQTHNYTESVACPSKEPLEKTEWKPPTADERERATTILYLYMHHPSHFGSSDTNVSLLFMCNLINCLTFENNHLILG